MKSTKLASEALTYWLKKSGLTQQKLAEMSGLAQNYISQIKTGTKEAPSFKAIEKISDALGISIQDFLAYKYENTTKIVFIERIKDRPRAEAGGWETKEEDDDVLYPFHRRFIADKRGTPETMKIFKVPGDGMEPTLMNGDLIMINGAEKDIRSGQIYLLRFGTGEDSELMVKRLERRPGNLLLIRSDNERYEPITINMANDGEIEIFGRMVWSCREY